jgi:hypothetical protein
MGEKGIAADLPGAASPASIVERTTTTVTSTVTNAAEDVFDKVRDHGISAAADATVDEIRERAKREPGDPGEPTT